MPETGDVHTEALQLPRVRLRGVVPFEASAVGARLTECLHIEAAMTAAEAVKAHVSMLTGTRRCFD